MTELKSMQIDEAALEKALEIYEATRGSHKTAMQAAFAAYLSAASAPVAVPDGWKLVPIISTGEMMAGAMLWASSEVLANTIWRAMLAAAPPPAQPVIASHETPPVRDNASSVARSAVADHAGLVVKRLEWHKSHMKPWNGDYHTVPTAYNVRCADENGWKWQGIGAHGYASSPDGAMAAAQRDHETRILSALSTKPKPETAGDVLFAWWAETGTSGTHDDCNKLFFMRELAVERVQRHGGHVRALYAAPPAAVDRNAVIGVLERKAASYAEKSPSPYYEGRHDGVIEAIAAIRALKDKGSA